MMRKANRKTRESLWFDIGWFTAETQDVRKNPSGSRA